MAKKYTEIEIIEVVLKAIQPGSNLRSYLENRRDIDLVQLKQIIRAHYKEQNATELYQELSNVTQSSKEDPTEFLMRALGLRQKVLFVSSEKGSGLTYSRGIVDGMFIDDTIRHEILPTLVEKDFTDEKLIEALNKIYLTERERKVKLGKCVNGPQLSSVDVVTDEEEKKPPKPVKKGVFLTELRALKAEVIEMNKSMSNNQNSASGSSKKVPKKMGCEQCRQKVKEKSCQHCWRCGSDEHFAEAAEQSCRETRQGYRSRGDCNPGGKIPVFMYCMQ